MISLNRKIEVCYEDLLEEHDEIERISRRLEQLVDAVQPDELGVATVLSSLAKAVAGHLRKEDSFVYPALVDDLALTGSKDLVLEFELMKARWQKYVATWQQHGALTNWAEFSLQTREILNDLRANALNEVGRLYSVGLREGLVILRSQFRALDKTLVLKRPEGTDPQDMRRS